MLISVGHTYPDGEIGSILSCKIKAVACSSLLPGSLASCLPPQARVTPEREVTTVPFITRDTTGLSELRGRRAGVEEGGHGQKLGTELWDLSGVRWELQGQGSPGRGEG